VDEEEERVHVFVLRLDVLVEMKCKCMWVGGEQCFEVESRS